jgi:hypothetical protein
MLVTSRGEPGSENRDWYISDSDDHLMLVGGLARRPESDGPDRPFVRPGVRRMKTFRGGCLDNAVKLVSTIKLVSTLSHQILLVKYGQRHT